MKEGILIEADINKHGFEALFDVFDAAFEDSSDDVVVAITLDIVFFKDTVLEESGPTFECF
jgi:hypothetical protein